METLDVIDLSTISGVVLATMFVVELLKRIFGKTSYFAKVPVFVYAMFVAIALGLLANKVLRNGHGGPLLEGETLSTIWRCAIAAMAASGFYTWLRNPEPMKTAHQLLLLTLSLSIVGCR